MDLLMRLKSGSVVRGASSDVRWRPLTGKLQLLPQVFDACQRLVVRQRQLRIALAVPLGTGRKAVFRFHWPSGVNDQAVAQAPLFYRNRRIERRVAAIGDDTDVAARLHAAVHRPD